MSMSQQITALQRLSVTDLRARYADTFGEATRANNRDWLVKRLAWRLQALAEGDLTERARRRAEELANDADLRVVPPRRTIPVPPAEAEPLVRRPEGDGRLPPPGTIITRAYKGGTLQVKVLAEGFEFDGRVFPSLSAVAKAVTGSHCNGFLFFKLAPKGGRS